MTRHNLSKLNGGSQNRMAHTYDSKHREIFNDIEQGRIGKIVADLAASYAEHGEIHVVDFGAGTGNLTKFFLEKKFLVTACDVSRMSLDILKQKMGPIVSIRHSSPGRIFPLLITRFIWQSHIRSYTMFRTTFAR